MRRILRGQVFNRLSLLTLCFGLSFFYEAQAQVSGTYTINSAQPTGGTNFHSFTDAVNFLKTGLTGSVTINVQAGSGPYNEQVVLTNQIGTSATKTLTFNCNGVTLRFLSTNPNQRAGIKLDNISYVTFDKLKITPQAANDGEYGYGFHLLNNSDNNVIQNCTIINQTNYDTAENNEGIVINGNNGYSTSPGSSFCDNNVIQNNTISGGGNGITLSSVPVSGAPQLMQGNKILNNKISDPYYNGIELYYNDGTLVDGNDIQGGPNTVGVVAPVIGILLNTFDQNVKVTNNKIHNFHVDPAIDMSYIYGILNTAQGAAGNPNLLANNLIYDFSNISWQYGIATRFGSASYFNVYHNTISLDDQTVPGASSDGMYFQNVTDVNVRDNIVTVSRMTGDWNSAIGLSTWARVTSDRNVFYVTGSFTTNAVGFLSGRNVDLLSDWQIQSGGLDYHSVFLDPQYTNLASFQFTPTAAAIDNMGTYVNINTDIAGTTRSTVNPDPGCYEFTSAPCSSPITPGTVAVLPDTVLCLGPSIGLGLTGNTFGSGQTYTWQSSSTAGGTYTNISSSLAYPAFDITPATTVYYRAAVTCGASTVYTAPMRVIVNTMLPAGTYTINSTQPTGGINFNSFNDAVLAMQCGITGSVVFNVAPNTGPYTEQVIIPALNTSATKTITFNCNGDTLSFAAKFSSEKAVIKLNGADYVTFDSLNIKVKGATFGYGVQLLNDADHNTVKRCSVSLPTTNAVTDYAGIVISPSPTDPQNSITPSFCDTNTIANNTITGGYYGITCTSGTATMPSGNTFKNNTIKDACGYGIYMDGVAFTLVDSNDISQPTRKVVRNFSGVFVKQGSTFAKSPYGVQISRNRIHNLLESRQDTSVEVHGIHFERATGVAANPNIVSNNLLYNFYGIGFQYGMYTIGSNYVKFFHNTISLEDSTALVTDATVPTCGFGVFSLNSGALATGVEFKNNSVIIRRGGTGQRTGIFLNLNESALVSDNNNYLVPASTGTSNIGYLGGSYYSSLSGWQGTGKDASSINLDPLYKDPLNADFTPTYIPFDDKGTPVGVPIDILDSTRSITKPDIGAYEFTICFPLSTPVMTLDSVGVYTIRFAWTPVTNTTGYLVSRDGINWAIPSSGPMGTTHTVTGLKARDTVGLMVKALGTRWDCPPVYSQRIVGQTITDQIFIPNTFTPNGNGKNDVFKVYSNIIQSLHLMVFNQWGEKVFETTDLNAGWDGTYKGKPQPIGVYVYVATMVLSTDNSTITKKGTFNLIR